MQRRAKYSFGLAVSTVVLVLLAAPACYTLLKHPRVKTAPATEVADNRCTSCHLEDELWAFHHPANHPSAYPVGWDQYYLVPWWYAAYWHFEPERGAAIPQPLPQSAPGAQRMTNTSGGAANIAPIETMSPSPGAAEGKSKGNDNDASSKNHTVRPKANKGGKGND